MKRAIKSLPVDQGNMVWKESPPGPEQRELERLFKNKLIDPMESPITVRNKNSMCMEFSPRVFAAHFRKTKAKYGLFAKPEIYGDLTETIPELGSTKNNITPIKKQKSDCCDFQADDNNLIQFFNPPFATWTYMDHDKKCNYVNVALPIISGSTDINFDVSEDGLAVHVNYVWPVAIFNPKELYFDEIHNKNADQKISPDHPKIHALATHLLQSEITENSSPKGKIIIKLPVAVVREIDGWTKRAIKKNDGTKIVLLEFKAFQDKTIIKDSDTSIVFD